jgi:hypothetical protein
MQLTEWLLVEVALLLIGLTKVFLKKSSFDHPFCNIIAYQAAGPVPRVLNKFGRYGRKVR